MVHISLIVPEGRSRLPSIFRFTASFEKSGTRSALSRRRPPNTTLKDLKWWRECLLRPFCGIPIVNPPTPSEDIIWVDASSSWGIGIVFNDSWQAWKLSPGWKTDGRDIGWAEAVAIELAICEAIARGIHDAHIIIRSDNQGVIGGLKAGRSRGLQQNRVLRRIVALFAEHRIWVSSTWVTSATNRSDNPSRGALPVPPCPRSTFSFTLPAALTAFLSLGNCT